MPIHTPFLEGLSPEPLQKTVSFPPIPSLPSAPSLPHPPSSPPPNMRNLLVGLVAAALAATAARAEHTPHVADLSQVTRWPATALVTDPARFAELRGEGGTKCGQGTCAFEGAICCEKSNTCCEWGACTQNVGGVAECSSSPEMNALLLAKAFAKDEAAKEVKHEQNLKAKSEQGVKLVSEAKEKNTQEAAEKKEATAEEAQAKKDATNQHEARLARREANEERSKTRESAAKHRAQKAMVNRFQKARVAVYNAGRPFNARAGKCWTKAARGSQFTVSAWVYNKDSSTSGKRRHIFSANSVQVYTRYAGGRQRLGVTVVNPNPKLTRRYEARSSMPVHQWFHVSVVVAGGRVRLYLNTKHQINKRVQKGFRVMAPGGVKVCASLSPALDARIADLQMVNSVQSAAARAALYKARKHDRVASSLAVETVIEGPWSPEANKLVGKNNMKHSGAYSTGLWLRATGNAATETNVFHKGDSNGGPSVWLNVLPKGSFGELQIRSGSGTFVSYAVPNDKWFHFMWTHGGGKLTVYVNGKSVKRTSLANAKNIAGMPLYASNPWSRQTPAAPIIAANLVFAPKVLAASDIRSIIAKQYDHAYMPPGKVLVKLADTAKNTLRVKAAEVDDSTCRTWAAWLKPTAALAGWRSLFHKGTGTAQRAPAAWYKPGSTKLHFRSGTSAQPNAGLDYDTDLPIGVWSHVAFVHCNRKMLLFINAQKKGENLKVDAPDTNDGDLYVPKTQYGRAASHVADIRYWTIALNKEMVHKVFEKAEHP